VCRSLTGMSVTNRRTAVRVPKTAELVASKIRRQIVLRQLRQDDALPPENELMEDFGISRPTLREAFRILESEGLIVVRRGAKGGARVMEPSGEVAARHAGLVLQHRGATVADVLDARVIVEAPAAEILASRRDRKAIADRLEKFLDEVDPEVPERFHEFNALVVELTENQTLMLVTTMLEHIGQAATRSFVSRSDEVDRAVLARKSERTRRKLIEHIRAGDVEAAGALWRKHLTTAGQILAQGTEETVVDLF
jgi:GntR family transcriptional regulator, transcriptional repressor for pyruvate dehydrogenase complex